MKIRDVMIKEGQSDWYSTYQDLVEEVGRFDINKRRFPLVEGTLHYNEKPDFEKTVDELKKKYIFLAENSLFLLSPLYNIFFIKLHL